MLNVVCINAGNYCGRGVEYVNILHDMVRRNLPGGFEGRFICFTDDMDGAYSEGITVSSMCWPRLDGWWNKLALFQNGLFPIGDRVLYCDLDTVITGRLDEIVKYEGEFAILRDAYRPAGWQSAVMAWRAGACEHLWITYKQFGFPDVDGGDQAWIEFQLDRADILQDLYPDSFASYKVSGGELPDKASVVFFHGTPRPHEVTEGWVPHVWKIGGMTRAEFDMVPNLKIDDLFNNIRTNVQLRFPRLQVEQEHEDHAVIVGGGPSLGSQLKELRYRYELGQHFFALNGAAAFLHKHGMIPHAHVICDARPENIKFLSPVLPDTSYLIASQCHPSLFRLLQGSDVTMWHSDGEGVQEFLMDPTIDEPPGVLNVVSGGCTVGLQAMAIADTLGYRKLHIYGMDSSVADDGGHHVYDQSINDNDRFCTTLTEGGKTFRAAPWMVRQAQQFVWLAYELAQKDHIITVHGEGLLPHMAQMMMRGPPVDTSVVRAEEILKRLPSGPVIGAEIGVFTGALSRRLLKREDLTLIMVDSWAGNGRDYIDKEDFHAKLSQEKQDHCREKAIKATSFAVNRTEILQCSSLAAANSVHDGVLDFVFIDADHSYEGCRADIDAWLPKLKPGGLLCGHDYGQAKDHPNFGVDRAVDEFIAKTGLTLELGDNFCWFVRLPAKAKAAA